VCKLRPPATNRRWNAAPEPAVIAMNACGESAAKLSRIITPALAQPSVFSKTTTRAIRTPFPCSGR
jgi:hypothetical protein